MFLQSYVTPVCLYEVVGGRVFILKLIGSAFFFNNSGYFLTARHVICEAIAAAEQYKGQRIALIVKAEGGVSPTSMVTDIMEWELASEPCDVAIGRTNYHCKTLLSFAPFDVNVWQDVAAYGYPISAVSGEPSALRLNIRCHKGYIQRCLAPGDIHVTPNPPAFELSFLLSRGLSGAPLFVHREPRDVVIGVCVGSIRSEVTDDEHTEVLDDGRRYTEKKMKIEEYGIAHDLRPLHTWKPKLLKGKSLLEASNQ